MEPLIRRLKMLEAKHRPPQQKSRHLKVFYGWTKINKTQRQEGIDVAFENMENAGSDERRFIKTLRKSMDIVAERDQTPEESMCATGANRMFTVYHLFLNQPGIDGSLQRILTVNRQDDEGKGIPKETLDDIANNLKEHFLDSHPGYKEPELTATLPFND